MTTIDVVSLENVSTPDVEEKVDVAAEASSLSEKNEVESSRKRGRPAGAKDAKRRKTPVRRKTGDAASSSTSTISPLIVEEPVASAKQPVIQPVIAPPPAVQIAITPKEPERSHYHHRMDYHEQVSTEEAHWDNIINPMFHHHRRRIY